MITHRWFRSGAHSLLGHVHHPDHSADHASLRGVVIVPPFGWEEVCCYRPLRELAKLLAGTGVAVIRYDLPATGDSTGQARDAGLVEAWIESVGAAADELRAVAGVETVSVVGVRLGAVLALAAAARGATLTDLVLWGGAAAGRSLTRELRAFRNMEVPEFGEAAPRQPPDDGGIEAGGFYLAPASVAALEALDLTALPDRTGRRVLVLTRDEFAADKKLVAALKSAGGALDQLPGPGYADMMAVPHEARLNLDTAETIANWLAAGKPAEAAASKHSAESVPRDEQVVLLPQPEGQSFGLLAPGTGRNGLYLLLLNPGAGRHIGPNRLWVDLAREWSARGVGSLRLDLAGIGESDGVQNLDVEGLYNEGLVAQVDAAMQYLEGEHGARQFAIIGLCSGAFWAFHAAAGERPVRAAILLNPRLFFWDPEVDRRREKQRNVNAVAKADAWKRLVTGQVPADRIRSAVRDVLGRLATNEPSAEVPQIPAAAMNRTLALIRERGARLSMIFTEGEPLLHELEDEGFLGPQPSFHCLRVSGAGHTFRPLWAQAQLRQLIEAELAVLLSGLSC